MNHTPRAVQSRKKLIAAVCALGLLLTACAADPVATTDTADTVEAITTNDGAISVKPPDVLAGEADTAPDVAVATSVPIEPAADGADATEGTGSGLLPIPPNDFVWFDGTPGSTAQLAGTPTVLNFWSSNCAACVSEMPDFEAVYQALDGQVAFIGMNRDDTREFALQLAEDTGVTYPLAEDVDSKMFIDFRAFAMPTTVFLNEASEVTFVWQGGLTGEDLTSLIDQHLLGGAT